MTLFNNNSEKIIDNLKEPTWKVPPSMTLSSGTPRKKYKASDIEKDWSKGLAKRGVLTQPLTYPQGAKKIGGEVPQDKKCEVSGQYGKDNDKNLHFYCHFCDKEMEYDEIRICMVRNKVPQDKPAFGRRAEDVLEETEREIELLQDNRSEEKKYIDRIENQRIDQLKLTSHPIFTPAPQENWSDDWTGYCRTYLRRYKITDEVTIVTIAGNLEQVVKKILTDQKEQMIKKIDNLQRLIIYSQDWDKEFDKKFVLSSGKFKGCLISPNLATAENIKSFISQLLFSQKEQIDREWKRRADTLIGDQMKEFANTELSKRKTKLIKI